MVEKYISSGPWRNYKAIRVIALHVSGWFQEKRERERENDSTTVCVFKKKQKKKVGKPSRRLIT